MSELERIKNSGLLSPSFFLPEEKCDFYVSEQRKMLWTILLDLLIEFQRVCKKHNLTYYAMFGTLLGAIRHKGIIPWDDDLDVAMPRTDYERLKSLKNEFKFPYHMTWPDVESENGYSFIKLRNSETTAMPYAYTHLDIDQGIFLDIFPYDEVNEATYYSDQSIIKELLIRNSNNMKMLKNEGVDKDMIRADILETFHKIENLAQKDNGKGYDKIAFRTISFDPPERLIWSKANHSNSFPMKFEEFEINIPEGWEKILEVSYGDWKKMPPAEERGIVHANAIFDPNLPYSHYQNQ